MDFEIPEDLKMMQSLVRDFVTDQIKPLERDLMGRAADLSDARTFLPEETEAKLVKMARDIGLWGTGIPEEFGGAGLGTLGSCLIEEELAQTVIPFNFGDVSPVLFDCNDKQREKYFLPVLNRQKYAYMALMEPDKSSLPEMKTTAEKASLHYVLTGTKVSLSRPGKDYFAVVFAAMGNGTTCFLIDKDTPGFTVKGGEETSGWHSQTKQALVMTFENCKVPAENVLGAEGKAFHLGKKWLPARRIVRGARSVGVAARLLEEATIKAQSAESFGKSIAGRPSIQAALADIAMSIHAGRLMVYEAAWKADKGETIKREASMVKLFTTRMLYQIADNVAHIFNGPAYVAGLSMERLCRPALATSATDLALELQRNIIAKDILKGLKV
ncbi:MAG: acyl-CoA dehydrogenase family protein [Dehalococcoidales bacterium]|nr:acyl-CoA dehydrogenase family protein [Dehalococcoidales bacterium]